MSTMILESLNLSPDLPYVISQYIREYDISKCNINMLLLDGKIDRDLYKDLYHSPKYIREIKVGNMIKSNSDLYNSIKNNIIKYRNMFFSSNGITNEDILTVKSDAIFTINKLASHTVFDEYVEFINKNTYTSFFKIENLELYYNSDLDILDVKGINDKKLKKHTNGMLDLLKTIIFLIESNDLEYASKIISNIYNDYLNDELPIDYYRSFDSNSSFKLKSIDSYLFSIPPNCSKRMNLEKEYSTNIKLLIELNKIINSLILRRK